MHIIALLKCGKIKSQFFLIYRIISCNIEKIRQFNYRKLYLIVCLPNLLHHWKSKRVVEKHLLLLYWLCQSLWLYGSQQTVENCSRDGNTNHLICLLRNLYAGQEATVRTGHGTTDLFQIEKGVCQGCISSPCLFNLYAEYITQNSGLDEFKLESRLPGEILITSDTQITPCLWQKVKN